MVNFQTYRKYSVEDFVDDQCFWLWALQEEEGRPEFWETFMQENPDKIQDIEQAKSRVLKLNEPEFIIEQEKAASIWTKIVSSINS